jgi:cyanate permease
VLALDHAGQPTVAGRLVAFMQGIGFIIAGLSPWLSGLLRSLSGNYTLTGPGMRFASCYSWRSRCALSQRTTRPSGDSAPLICIKPAARGNLNAARQA